MEVGSDQDEGASSWKSICVCCTCTSSRRSLLITTTTVPVSRPIATSSPFIIDVARASKGPCFSGASTRATSATTLDSLTYMRSKISIRRRATTPVSTAFPLQSLASRAAQRYLHCWTCSRLSTDVNRPPVRRTRSCASVIRGAFGVSARRLVSRSHKTASAANLLSASPASVPLPVTQSHNVETDGGRLGETDITSEGPREGFVGHGNNAHATSAPWRAIERYVGPQGPPSSAVLSDT
jgi:hypothetical protein